MPIMRSLVDKFDRKKMIITATASVIALGTTIGVIAGTSHKKAENIKVPTQYVNSNAIKLDTGIGVSAKQIYLKLVNSGSITESDFQLGKPKDGFSGSFVIYANAAAEFNIRDTQKLTVTYEDGSEKKDFTESGDYNEVIEVYSAETEQTYKFRVEFTVLTKSVYVEPTTSVTTKIGETTDKKTTSVTAIVAGKTESTASKEETVKDSSGATDTNVKPPQGTASEEKHTEAPKSSAQGVETPRTPAKTEAPKTETPVKVETPVRTEAPATQPPTNPPTQPVVTNPPATQPEPTQPPQVQPVVEEPTEYDPIAEARALCRTEQEFAWFDYAVRYMRSMGVTSELQLAGQAEVYTDFCRNCGEENVVLDDLDGKGIMAWYLAGYDDETGEEIWRRYGW